MADIDKIYAATDPYFCCFAYSYFESCNCLLVCFFKVKINQPCYKIILHDDLTLFASNQRYKLESLL